MTFDELFQYYANMGFGTQMVPQQTQEGIASLIQPIQTVPTTGGSDGVTGGGGVFGNLDLSQSKNITRDIYQDVLGPSGSFEFSPEQITGYYNPSTGTYQTLQGKNINPMFSNTGTTFGIVPMALKMMGLTQEPVGGFVPNSIRGDFDTPKDFINMITGGGNDKGPAPSASPARTSQGVTSAQHSAFRN